MGNQILMVYTFCSWYIGVVVCHTENTEIINSHTDLTDLTDLLNVTQKAQKARKI